jgi:bifunctional DNA-binding transcriptional regulator/antitoxin component of YhaV-PrlF toxin-antitoxin module
MLEFRSKVAEGGRIMMSAACRRALNLSVGDEVIIRVSHDEAQLYSLKHALKRAQDLLKKRNPKKLPLTDLLIQERSAEAKRE